MARLPPRLGRDRPRSGQGGELRPPCAGPARRRSLTFRTSPPRFGLRLTDPPHKEEGGRLDGGTKFPAGLSEAMRAHADRHTLASPASQAPLEPMEAKLVDELPTGPGWQFEPKW